MTEKEIQLSIELIKDKIHIIRGQKVMLDRDLAQLYGVTTGRLNEQVKRNSQRFPGDFMFRLDFKEYSQLISQISISKKGGTRKMPYVFTEQGVAMLSSVLNSERAIQVNIQIMRAFVKIKELMSIHQDIYKRMNKLELKQLGQDKSIININSVIEEMLNLPVTLKRKSQKNRFQERIITKGN